VRVVNLRVQIDVDPWALAEYMVRGFAFSERLNVVLSEAEVVRGFAAAR
jgi:hypothetical protein